MKVKTQVETKLIRYLEMVLYETHKSREASRNLVDSML